MFGKSWAGFNGLQVAFCQPKALKAIVSLYSTGEKEKMSPLCVLAWALRESVNEKKNGNGRERTEVESNAHVFFTSSIYKR